VINTFTSTERFERIREHVVSPRPPAAPQHVAGNNGPLGVYGRCRETRNRTVRACVTRTRPRDQACSASISPASTRKHNMPRRTIKTRFVRERTELCRNRCILFVADVFASSISRESVTTGESNGAGPGPSGPAQR